MAIDNPVEAIPPAQSLSPEELAKQKQEAEAERKRKEQEVPDETLSAMTRGLVALLMIMIGLFLLFLAKGVFPGMDADVRLAILVMLSGGLGAYIHAAHSFVTYIGTQEIKRSWLRWYYMRPFVGMSLALVFFLLYRANVGELPQGADTPPDKEFMVLAIGALVGMFSKQAIQKLGEIFDVILRAKSGEELKQKDSMVSKDSNAKTAAKPPVATDLNKPNGAAPTPTPDADVAPTAAPDADAAANSNEPNVLQDILETDPNAKG